MNKAVDRQRISQRVQRVRPSGIRKFFDIVATMQDIISLGVGEPDFITPAHIREAGILTLEKGLTKYTSNQGIAELREEISRSLIEQFDLLYDYRHELLVTVGVSEGLDLALRALIDPGDEVICADPGYVAYQATIILAGAEPVIVPTSREQNFELKATAIERAITPRTKVLLIGNPNNPTGAIIAADELQAIASLVARHNLIVIVDEVYNRLVYDTTHTCFAALPGMQSRTVMLNGFSKAYAMTGWRIGYAAGPAEIIEAMLKIHQYTIMCVPTQSQYAALEALRAGESDVAQMRQEYDQRRRFMVAGLNRIGLNCFEPKGAFYVFPSICSTGMNCNDFAEQLLQEEKIAVVPGDAFGDAGAGFVRMSYCSSMPDLHTALERIERFVQRHR